jgi:hypothetical protein
MSSTASFLSQRPILDLCSGFWGVSTQRFADLKLTDSSFAIEAELVLKSVRRGYTIHQIPIPYHERVGEPKLRAIRDGGRILRTIIQQARPRPDTLPHGDATAPRERDLLSIGLTLGSFGALREDLTPGAREPWATPGSLPVRLPPTPVRIAAPLSIESPFALAVGADFPSLSVPLLLPTRTSGSDSEEAHSVTVSIRSNRRQLTITLPPVEGESSGVSADPRWPRSGGFKDSRLPHRTRYASLLVVTSRLNFEPARQQQTLLSANGFHVVLHPIDASEGVRPAPTAEAATQS